MVFETLAKLIADRVDCDVASITPESTFAELNFDSLDTTEMLLDLEDELDKTIDVEPDETIKTVGDLAELIEQSLQ